MIVIENNKINKIFREKLEKSIPKELLDQNPVISGGFTLATLIFEYDEFSKHYFSKNFHTKIELNRIKYNHNLRYKNNLDLKDNILYYEDYFGDIDCFFLKGNKKIDLFLSNIKDIKTESTFYFDNSLYNKVKGSRYAYNFYSEDINVPKIQIIKKKYLNLNDLFESFDIINNKVAWIDDKIYIDDDAYQAIINKELKYNEDYSKCKTIVDEVFQALRLIKYHSRYDRNNNSFSYSKESADRLFSVYKMLDFEDVESYRSVITKKVNTAYGKSNVAGLYNMLYDFIAKFSLFVERNEYLQEVDLLYFINSDFPTIEHTVKSLLKRYSFPENIDNLNICKY